MEREEMMPVRSAPRRPILGESELPGRAAIVYDSERGFSRRRPLLQLVFTQTVLGAEIVPGESDVS